MNAEPHSGNRGFTLIEVLVALAIVAFGLIAVFGQLNQTATAASRLRDKTLAHWVALDRITELRLSGQYPGVGTRSDEIDMAKQRWHYEVRISETEGNYLRRADVTVALADSPTRPLATAVGFIGQPQTSPTGGTVGGGWPLCGAEDAGTGSGAPAPPPLTPAPVPPPEGGEDTGAAEQ